MENKERENLISCLYDLINRNFKLDDIKNLEFYEFTSDESLFIKVNDILLDPDLKKLDYTWDDKYDLIKDLQHLISNNLKKRAIEKEFINTLIKYDDDWLKDIRDIIIDNICDNGFKGYLGVVYLRIFYSSISKDDYSVERTNVDSFQFNKLYNKDDINKLRSSLLKSIKEKVGNSMKTQTENKIIEKDLGITKSGGAEANISDLDAFGNGDTFKLLCKTSSKEQGWMKSTKVCNAPMGCIVQVTTQQKNPDGSYAVAEALTYVPGCHIDTTVEPRTLGPIKMNDTRLDKDIKDLQEYLINRILITIRSKHVRFINNIEYIRTSVFNEKVVLYIKCITGEYESIVTDIDFKDFKRCNIDDILLYLKYYLNLKYVKER